MTMISNMRMNVGVNIKGYYLRMIAPTDSATFTERQQIEEHNRHQSGIWANSPNFRFNHYCTLDCLLQPSLTLVSRQVRAESLPFFYSGNKFHLEMSNFVLATTTEKWRRIMRSPTDWWRAAGDTNLGHIRHLSLFVPSSSTYHTFGVMIKYSRPIRKPQSVRVSSPPPEAQRGADGAQRIRGGVPDDWAESLAQPYMRKLRRQDTEEEERLQPHIDVLKTEALHVRVLECIIAELEPIDVNYLHDEQALDGPIGSGPYVLPPVDEVDDV